MSVSGAGMAASAVSAYIQCLELPMPPIVFSYNPEGYTVVTQANWKKSPQPATNGPQPQFQGVSPPTLDVKILLDAFAVPPVPPSVVIDQLKLLVLPTELSMGMGSSSAPTVMFGWGPNIIMDQAIVTKVSVAYERFLLGVPVRATATVHLEAVPLPAPLGPTNPTSGGLTTRKTRTLVEGDTLASIAYQEYRDPNKWRALAEANNIDDPMRIKEGKVLIVPDRREAEALS
jgi:nucleoid-associated protein YgaU